ncbi:exodeoxyribonuclease V subunit gamma [Acinetobacter sp. NIPH 2699]|uniref:exodeoxyribonuclease V subunit gamma n=1 Tax=Acinetobacter sp. NIPH 2699 TaxID=2923433 RepID=UPI001F4A86BF|nr:exodeoxyribonuclease V subunit gamma [Acinetobacter sp. NIPH 2699]MCH7335464.1 exodeoxyribonuclease V subunit gamma [Acinetobacter sp. NIPH 2699]
MAIHVIQSQRLEVLLQGVMASITQPSTTPFQVFKTQHFIVPSPAQEQWLTQKVAEQQGMTANYQFHQRIRGFQWYAYQQVLDDKEKVRKANIPRLILKWRIHQALQPFIQPEQINLAVEHPLYSIVQRIYDSADQLQQGTEKQLKKQSMLYWVAEQVSQLFNNYMIYRGYCQRGCQADCTCPSNWLSAWGQNQALDIENLISHTDQQTSAFTLNQTQQLEAWQRWLWQNYFHADFLEMQSIDADFWKILDNDQTRSQALAKLPNQVIVFTLLDLPPSQLQFLRRLGQYLDVVILHYNPSQEYWADSVDPLWKQRYDLGVKERFIVKNPKATDVQIAAFFESFSLGFNALNRESRHPLLTRFGKQARDHFSLLSQLATGEEGNWVDAFEDYFPDSLLGQVQSDIFYLAEPTAQQYELAPHDESIQFHVCHSSLRQLEVLKEQLVHWLSQADTTPRRPNDVLILTPNLAQLEPLIRSVFPAVPNEHEVFLPVKIAGVAQLDALNAWRAVLGRLQLPQGRFTQDEFADWLNLSATQQRYGLDYSQGQRMLALLNDAGFKRGLDEEHLKQSLSNADQDYRYSFKFALDRLALGIAVPAHVLVQQTLSYAGVQPSDFELIGILIQIYQDFAARRDWLTVHQQGQRLPVETWLTRIKDDVQEFEHADVMALKAVREIVQKQERMLTLASYYDDAETQLRQISLPLPYILEEIQRTLESQSAQVEPTGQITFSQIGQIRPIPYRLIVLLNLDTGKFPNRDSHIPFDLMDALRQQLGDRSRLEDDQGAFLDAVLLAQEQLWLFYNGFDVNDGEVREPSSVLLGFRDHLALIVKTPEQVLMADESSAVERVSLPKSDVIERADQAELDALQIPPQLYPLYHLHRLQPFDPLGFIAERPIRYQDQWFKVAAQIQQAIGERQAWINTPYPIENNEMTILDSRQWIQDVTFPARLYLKTLGVENLSATELADQTEPLLLDGLGKYAIRHFLQQQEWQQSNQAVSPMILQDQLPVGKVQQSAWQQSCLEQQRLLERLQQYAPAPTETTQRVWRVSKQLQMRCITPKSATQDWVSLDASSARAKRLAKVWLEYLLWLTVLESNAATDKRRIVVFSDYTVICEGLSTEQARAYLQAWLQLWQDAQQQPVVLPAALLLKPLEKGKHYDWIEQHAQHIFVEESQKQVLKDWNDTGDFSGFDMTQNEACKLHRDWQFILQEQDAAALLKYACDHYSYALYQPIFEFLRVE